MQGERPTKARMRKALIATLAGLVALVVAYGLGRWQAGSQVDQAQQRAEQLQQQLQSQQATVAHHLRVKVHLVHTAAIAVSAGDRRAAKPSAPSARGPSPASHRGGVARGPQLRHGPAAHPTGQRPATPSVSALRPLARPCHEPVQDVARGQRRRRHAAAAPHASDPANRRSFGLKRA